MLGKLTFECEESGVVASAFGICCVSKTDRICSVFSCGGGMDSPLAAATS